MIVRLLCEIFIFFEKKLIKNLEMGYKLFYLCSRNQEPMYWTNGGGERVWCVGLQVFRLCVVLQDIALVGFWKKLQKFLLKSLEVMKKSLPLQPLSETKRTFWNILTDVFFIFCGWSLQKLSSTAVPKKSLKKSAERFGGNM